MRYFVIGDDDTVLGFGMVGVQGRVVEDAAQAASAFAAAIAWSDAGIVIITERAADLIRPRVTEYSFRKEFPLIVEIPDRRGRIKGRPSIRETVNAAIGVKL
jgi:V/A-type H+-transporting ATPase subunit F